MISPGRRNLAFRVRNQPKTAGGASRKKFSAPPTYDSTCSGVGSQKRRETQAGKRRNTLIISRASLEKAALDLALLQASGPSRLALPAIFLLRCSNSHPPEIVWSVDPADADSNTVVDHKSRARASRLACRGAGVQALELCSSRATSFGRS